jgi:hypothetical protein
MRWLKLLWAYWMAVPERKGRAVIHKEHGVLQWVSWVDFVEMIKDHDWHVRVNQAVKDKECLGWVMVQRTDGGPGSGQTLFMVGPRVTWLSSWAAVEKHDFKSGVPVAFCENKS